MARGAGLVPVVGIRLDGSLVRPAMDSFPRGEMSVQSERSLQIQWRIALVIIMIVAMCSLLVMRAIQAQGGAASGVPPELPSTGVTVGNWFQENHGLA